MADDVLQGWHPDPVGRYDERYFIDGEPTQLVRSDGTEMQDRVSLDAHVAESHHVPSPRPQEEGADEKSGPITTEKDWEREEALRQKMQQQAFRRVGIVLALFIISGWLLYFGHGGH